MAEERPPGPVGEAYRRRRGGMHDSVWPAVAVVGVLAGWFALQRWILPAFGVST